MNTIHASSVIYGTKGLLILGVSGAGKSSLVLEILENTNVFSRLIGDDRVYLENNHQRLLCSPHPQLMGKLEVRGFGIIDLAYEPQAVIHGIIQLEEAEVRLPIADSMEIMGITLPKLVLSLKNTANSLNKLDLWLK